MNRNPLVWLLLALVLGAYAVSIFVSDADQPWWSTLSGIIIAAASVVALWKFSREVKKDRQP
jgi:membrane protein implicated in regulation of membrane protease activity